MNQPSFFHQLYVSIADRGRDLVGLGQRPEGEPAFVGLCRALLAQAGEATAAAVAQTLVETCQHFDAAQRLAFFRHLASAYSPDPTAAFEAARAYREAPSPATLRALTRISEPPRQELFRRMNMAPNGTATLVGLRTHLLNLLRTHPELAVVDDDLRHLFASWFNRGFLTLAQVNWRSSAALLEKLITYEAVHAFAGWHDLRRRLAADRRCFAFFHPALPEEPLIFVQIALTKGMAGAVAPFVTPDQPLADPQEADTAIFYSISNCQKGLRGVSFGNFLIKQVAAELRQELPQLKSFATLSPMPGFRAWLARLAAEAPEVAEAAEDTDGIAALHRRLQRQDWPYDEAQQKSLRAPLTALGAHYLLHERRGDGAPVDAVARFHLGNGARLHRVNWLADLSAKGMQQSAGLMVNYHYRLDQLEQNHEAYVNEHRVVAERAVVQAAKNAPLPQDRAQAA